MSLPLFLVDALPAADVATLDGPEGHHAATVARQPAGESLLLGDGGGATASATVTAVGKGALTVAINQRRHTPPPCPRLVVAQGIPKGDRGELAVQAMTEAGVDEIVPWAASRSVAIWRGERGARSAGKWAATAREAAQQARRAWLPVIAALSSTADLAGRVTLALHEAATMPLSSAPLPDAGEIVLAVGPEGGIADEELAAFTAGGAVAVRLGVEVLRTSTAGVAALSVLQARLGRW